VSVNGTLSQCNRADTIPVSVEGTLSQRNPTDTITVSVTKLRYPSAAGLHYRSASLTGTISVPAKVTLSQCNQGALSQRDPSTHTITVCLVELSQFHPLQPPAQASKQWGSIGQPKNQPATAFRYLTKKIQGSKLKQKAPSTLSTSILIVHDLSRLAGASTSSTGLTIPVSFVKCRSQKIVYNCL